MVLNKPYRALYCPAYFLVVALLGVNSYYIPYTLADNYMRYGARAWKSKPNARTRPACELQTMHACFRRAYIYIYIYIIPIYQNPYVYSPNGFVYRGFNGVAKGP